MVERKAFLLRMDPDLLAALQCMADDELRSLNGQIEFLLRETLRKRGRDTKTPSETPTRKRP